MDNFGTTWDTFGSVPNHHKQGQKDFLDTILGQFRISLEQIWDIFKTSLGQLCDSFETTSGQLGTILRQLRDHMVTFGRAYLCPVRSSDILEWVHSVTPSSNKVCKTKANHSTRKSF